LPNGNGTSPASLDIRVAFAGNLAAAYLADFKSSTFGVSFAAATCANDMLAGSNVPEPMTMSLIGLVGLGLTRRLRKTA